MENVVEASIIEGDDRHLKSIESMENFREMYPEHSNEINKAFQESVDRSKRLQDAKKEREEFYKKPIEAKDTSGYYMYVNEQRCRREAEIASEKVRSMFMVIK